MIRHVDLGDCRFARSRYLKVLIDKHEIAFAGNSKLRIYGTLNCKSGKRLKSQNRVFFKNKEEAVNFGYRPCSNCMHEFYKIWRAGRITIMNDDFRFF